MILAWRLCSSPGLADCNRDLFERWGISLDEAFKAAKDNLSEKTDPNRLTGQGSVDWGDGPTPTIVRAPWPFEPARPSNLHRPAVGCQFAEMLTWGQPPSAVRSSEARPLSSSRPANRDRAQHGRRSSSLRSNNFPQSPQQAIHFLDGVIVHQADTQEAAGFLHVQALGEVHSVVVSVPGEEAAIS